MRTYFGLKTWRLAAETTADRHQIAADKWTSAQTERLPPESATERDITLQQIVPVSMNAWQLKLLWPLIQGLYMHAFSILVWARIGPTQATNTVTSSHHWLNWPMYTGRGIYTHTNTCSPACVQHAYNDRLHNTKLHNTINVSSSSKTQTLSFDSLQQWKDSGYYSFSSSTNVQVYN